MSDSDDLTGAVDDRIRQLAAAPVEQQTGVWLRRQLDLTLSAWAADATQLNIDRESRDDF